MEFSDFNIDLYEADVYNDGNTYEPASSIAGTNSSTSIVCATLTNVTEDCNYCTPKH